MKTIIILSIYTLSLITGIFQFIVLGDVTGALGRTFNVAEDNSVIGSILDIRHDVLHLGNYGYLIK